MTESLSNYVLADRWRFQARLGHGSDGTVYLAADVNSGERVAIKVYDSLVGRGAERIREKLAEEAGISAGVDSPFVVRLIQYGTAPGQGGVDVGYMVMEFLEGETLRESIDRRVVPMAPAEAVDVCRRVLFAVNSLHRQGFVHRDLKPGNVFLLAPHTAEARRIPVKIFDFGAARPVERAHVGAARGTPLYCAPEVASRAKRIGLQADVYSLGIMFYELLAGTTPIDPTLTPSRIVSQAVYGELDPLPEPLCGTQYDEIYRRATCKDPDERYRDAGALLTALSSLRPLQSKRLPSLSPFSTPAITDDQAMSGAQEPTIVSLTDEVTPTPLPAPQQPPPPPQTQPAPPRPLSQSHSGVHDVATAAPGRVRGNPTTGKLIPPSLPDRD